MVRKGSEKGLCVCVCVCVCVAAEIQAEGALVSDLTTPVMLDIVVRAIAMRSEMNKFVLILDE